MPFYGWEFDENASTANDVRARSWCEIVSLFPDPLQDDQATHNNGATIYYNGETTIANKVIWAQAQQAKGVMIWELGQDCFNTNSLLGTIKSTIEGTLSADALVNNEFRIYPNPTKGIIQVPQFNQEKYQIYTISGKFIQQGTVLQSQINLATLTDGIYCLRIQNQSFKVIKQTF